MKKVLSNFVLQLLLAILFSSSAYADFGLMLGSFRNKDGAQEFQKTLIKQKYDAFIQEINMSDKGLWYRVSVGPFDTKEEALNQRKRMRSEGFVGDILIVKINAERVAAADKSNTQEKNALKQTNDKGVSKNVQSPAVQTSAERPVDKSGSETRKDITLSWDANKDPDLAGYKVYYDTDPNPPYDPDKIDYADEGPPPVTVASGITEITLHGLTKGKDYYFTITSFDKSGSESRPSDQITTASLNSPYNRPSPTHQNKPVLQNENIIREPSDKSSGSVEQTSLIAAGDIIRIEVPGQREMSKAYDVDPSGNIYLVIVGKVPVQGLNTDDLASKLRERLERYLGKEDKVTIELLERWRFIYIQGGVQYPGWYHVPYQVELDELIKLSGGLIPGADYDGIRLKRNTPDGYNEIEIKDKIILEPDDVLSVPSPEKYRETVDNGDLLFVNIPQRQAPTSRPDQRDSADLSESFTRNKVEADENGYVYIPDYGHVYVKGLTPEEIARTITERLPKYMAILGKVRVSILEKKHFIQLLGHVKKPGWYNVPETANIQEALVSGGGAIDGAVMSEVSIQRRLGDTVRAIKVNLYQYTIT
ncbi:MAG TPA: polysaccharide biosynthesis/export family protein, partial [Desulfobacteraceae bacterium]|nr:polysaccharide biosynthesis/export family protein [Desulfobacteraceae bacterium]HPJ68810.1 polysaccharide biosynthesis/export family protein [Desulfobacteraceae bacterium]HPQ29592.1 polysaccharide biosynthesis/export family protein [Desulfobacteraceae bacterium]